MAIASLVLEAIGLLGAVALRRVNTASRPGPADKGIVIAGVARGAASVVLGLPAAAALR